ncbi:hypothetical protein AB7C87_12690 [Natrarchaeobius sp. A-rgal3]|uniref:hypothetical protein n=1 Tax=Natrarchaeobius versutus TaxID=1679078 RepID=UPI0035100DBE
MMTIGQAIVTEWTETAVVNVFGFGLLTGVVGTAVAFVYRRYSTRPLPAGVAALVGLAAVGLWINAVAVRQSTIIDETPLFHHATATYFLAAFAVGSVAAAGGRRIGDAVACESADIDRIAEQGGAASIVRSGRLSAEYRLPDVVADLPGYPAIGDSVKRELAGRSVSMPYELPIDERGSRLENRLERDYGIEHVDVGFTSDGTVSRLRVGRDRTGIGATVVADTVALAVRGDPPTAGTTGDTVELWSDERSSQLVATGMLRATIRGVTTIVTDTESADELSNHEQYRLVTRPSTSTDVYELLSILRAVDHTVVRVTVSGDGPLDGEFVGWLSGTVLAIVRDDEVIPLPIDRVTLEADDDVYLLGSATDFDRLPTV